MSKVMIVEDDESLRQIYGIRLTAEGYTVISATNGEEALALAIQEKPDLILSDVMMPKISGFDMLDVLRSTPETAHTKVILMTALSGDEQRDRGAQLGADRYLVKSQVGIEDVVSVVKEVLAGDAGVAPAPTTESAATTEPAAATTAPAAEPVAATTAPAAPVEAPTIPVAEPVAPAPAQPMPPAPAVNPATPAPETTATPVAPTPEVPVAPAAAEPIPAAPAAAEPAPAMPAAAPEPPVAAPAPVQPEPVQPTPAPAAPDPTQPAAPDPTNPATPTPPAV